MNTKIIKLDINRRFYDEIVAKQDDTGSRFLLFQLLDGAVPFNLTDRSVRVYGVKPDGSVVFNDLTVTHSTTGFCLLELTNQMLAIAGIVKLELMITEGDKKLTSIPFEMEVIKKINSNAAVESSNEFGALLTALKEIDQWNREFADKSGKLEELYTPRLNELGSQLETKAKQTDLEIERKRIDLLTKIENGQTDGNTELLDIRIGADGFEYESAGDSSRGQFRKLYDTLNLKIIKKSSNYINSLSVKGKSFETVFPNSNKVYFNLGVGMSIPNNVKLMGRIIFADGTYPVGDGVWYADNKEGTTVLTGGNNIAKEITSGAETINKVGFYFGSSSRPNYAGKIIDKVIFTTYYENQANPIEDYYIQYGSVKLEDIEKALDKTNVRIDEIATMENKYICEWYNESEYIIAKGLELNIYYDTICKTNANVYFKAETNAISSFCNTLDRCFRFKTNSTVGEYNVTLKCLEIGSEKELGNTTFKVKVIENNVLTVAKKCMFIGDSLTDASIITKTVKELGGNNLKLYGVRGSGDNLHEGRSGWKCSTYLYSETYENKTNAFYNSSKVGSVKFDFNYYMQNNPSFSDVEFVNIFLGRNDLYNGVNLVGNLQRMIEDIHLYNPNIVISVALPYFTPRQSNEWGSIRKTNAEELYQASFVGYKNFKDGLSNLNNVYLVPLGVNLDIIYDFPYTQKAVSNRNSKTEGIYTDIIHPLECGYQKLADIWYSWFINYINTH